MFWWASLAAVGTAIDGMLIDGNGNLLVRRESAAYPYAWAQDDGMWKPDGASTTGTTDTGTTTTTETNTGNTGNTGGEGQTLLEVYHVAAKSKGLVVGSVACAGLVG